MICLYIYICFVGLTEFGPLVPSDQGHSLPMRILRASLAEPCGALPAENPSRRIQSGDRGPFFFGEMPIQNWLVVWLPFFISHILGMSSSQLTNSYFSEGWPNHQPVAKWWRNE